MNNVSVDADDDASARVTTLLREAAGLFEQGLAITGREALINEACAAGATLRLVVDFNMPARITGQVMHGNESVDVFSICPALALADGGDGLH